MHLLAGPPGSRKSGVALQLALDRGAMGSRSLFLLSEESRVRVTERAFRMLVGGGRSSNQRTLGNVALEEVPADPLLLPRHLERLVFRADAKHRGVDLVVLDSIQGGGVSTGADTAACRAALELAKRLQAVGIATLLVGHVTKQNLVRGPRSLEHAVDAVLFLDRRGGRRTLSVPKNRFGPAMLRPLPLVIDPVTTRITPAPRGLAQVATVRAYVPGTGLAELQVAASLPPGGGRGGLGLCRGTAPAEALHVLRCLGRTRAFEAVVPELDFAVACRWIDEDVRCTGGRRLHAESLHLPLSLAMAGACLGRSLPDDIVAVGEVDLGGRAYPVPRAALSELAASLRAGDLHATRLLCPSADARLLPWNCGCELAGVDTVERAVQRAWPDLDLEAVGWDC